VCSDYLYKRSGSPPPNREEEASLVLFSFARIPRSEHGFMRGGGYDLDGRTCGEGAQWL
jgi:hypothetical protein